jgi:hypothetical protein
MNKEDPNDRRKKLFYVEKSDTVEGDDSNNNDKATPNELF